MHTPDTAAYHMCLLHPHEGWSEEKERQRGRDRLTEREGKHKDMEQDDTKIQRQKIRSTIG